MVLKAFALRAELGTVAATGEKLAAAEKALVSAVEAERKASEGREQAATASHAAKADRDTKRAAYEALAWSSTKRNGLMRRSTRPGQIDDQKSQLEESISVRDRTREAVMDAEAALQSVDSATMMCAGSKSTRRSRRCRYV